MAIYDELSASIHTKGKHIYVFKKQICSLLHLSKQEISSIEITNPVILGKSIEDKEFRPDISVLLNNSTVINLEMQVEFQEPSGT